MADIATALHWGNPWGIQLLHEDAAAEPLEASTTLVHMPRLRDRVEG